MAGDNLHCQNCGHSYDKHHGECCYRKVGWNEETKSWFDVENCECKEYVGIEPGQLACPHELLPTDPTHCVACHKTVPARKG